MAGPAPYSADAPTREAINASRGDLLLEFGTDWCGHCQAAQPVIGEALAGHGDIAHRKIEDGKGRPLGRSFGVKLWPTLIVLQDGVEVARVVRPDGAGAVAQALQALEQERL